MKLSLSLVAVGLALPAVLAGGSGGGGGGPGGDGGGGPGGGGPGGGGGGGSGGPGGGPGGGKDCTTTTKTSTTTSSAVASATPTTCVYLGCYADPLGFPSRTLAFNSQVSEDVQTPALCQATCLAMGLKYAGLEYAFECWCGDVLHNNTPPLIDPAQCTSPCAGDASLTCGGREYMDLYDCSAALPEPEEFNDCVPLGCYTDSVSDRALKTSVEGGDANQSSDVCTAACIALGFRFAGTEYGRECWCADELAATGVLAPDGNEGCNMPCAGNATQTCGGKDRLNVFDCRFPTPSGTAPATVTVAPTSAPCPPKLVADFHGCFGNKRQDSLDFCYEWLQVHQVGPTTTTVTKARNGPRDLRYHGSRGPYGGKKGNGRTQTKLGRWPKLKDFEDDDVERACRCHVGPWWSAPVVTKTVQPPK